MIVIITGIITTNEFAIRATKHCFAETVEEP